MYVHYMIRKANPVADTGTYTCMAGPQSADVTIEFLSRSDAMKRIKDIRHYLADDSSKAVVLKPGEPSYQDGVVQDGGYNVTKKFVYMADDWSACSVTCGSGHQKRRVTCTRVTNKYVKILPERECQRLGLQKPEDMRKCSPYPECPVWTAGDWSKVVPAKLWRTRQQDPNADVYMAEDWTPCLDSVPPQSAASCD
nr:hypothetical protein BaRGS_006143 [Batillaria attramentaria]